MKAHGTLIQRFPYTETSLIVHWCTHESGIVKTVVKGACRPKSPFAGRLDLFYSCELEIVSSRSGDLHVLRDLRVLNARLGLRKTYLQTLAASYFVKWIRMVAEEGTPLPELADLLDRGLDYLGEKDADLRAILHFEKQLASLTGVTEAGVEPFRCLSRHFGGLPSQRASLLERIG